MLAEVDEFTHLNDTAEVDKLVIVTSAKTLLVVGHIATIGPLENAVSKVKLATPEPSVVH